MGSETGGSVAPPRDGLPPCVSQAIFGERVASLYDSRCSCGDLFSVVPHFCVSAGLVTRYTEAEGHPSTRMARLSLETNCSLHLDTDDADEAKAVYTRACEWVRTGELP